jgi:tetratricopeptide (TPR) repeat protein/tRNA A-37 threonylcarbamoyl transferase component Bud32
MKDEAKIAGSRIGQIRILDQLGAGGMGEIYRGFHELLERPVAVKVIRREKRLDVDSRGRFLREARLLSKLDHPHICRVYDLVEQADKEYLVLELVDGQTLPRAAADGLSRDQKLRIGSQIADALAAAHLHQVIHRDLKPENVMLTAKGEVKVLDFGIARQADARWGQAAPPEHGDGEAIAGEPTLDLRSPRDRSSEGGLETALGNVLGTPAFMSPEQASGSELTVASDLFSLGLVLRWLFSGRDPYPRSLSRADLLARVAQGEVDAVGELEPAIARILDRLLRRAPGERPSAATVRDELVVLRSAPSRRRRRRLFVVSAAVAILLAALGLTLLIRTLAPAPLLQPGEVGRVALLPLQNATGQAAFDWVEVGLTQMVADTLGQTPRVAVLRADEVLKTLTALGIPPGDELAPATLKRLARALGVNWLVSTRVELDGDGFRLRYTLFDLTGALGSRTLSGADLTQLGNSLSAQLSRRLDPEALRANLQDQFSPDPLLNQLYAMGLDRSAKGGVAPALQYFEVCLDRDPTFLRARHQLAASHYRIGEWEKAIAMLQEVAKLAREGKDDRALADALYMEASIVASRGDYSRAETMFAEVLTMQDKLGNRAGRAASLNTLGFMARQRNQLDAAERYFSDSLEIYQGLGDGQREIGRLINLAYVANAKGDVAAAERRFREARTACRELGLREEEASATLGIAAILENRGNWTEAATEMRAGHAIFLAIGGKRGQQAATIALGGIAARLGDFGEAQAQLTQGLALARELGDRPSQATALAELGAIAARHGNFAQADQQIAEAKRIVDELGDKNAGFGVLLRGAETRLLEKRWQEAEAFLVEALAITRNRDSLLLLAQLERERGRPARAVEVLLEAKAVAGEKWRTEDEARLVEYRTLARVH